MMALSIAAAVLAGCATAPAQGPSPAPPSAASLNHYLRSIMYEQDQEYDKSIRELERAAETGDHAFPIQFRLVMTYIRQGRHEEALEACKTAAEKAPDDPAIWTLLGRIYEHLERNDEAAEAYTRAAEAGSDGVQSLQDVVGAHLRSNDLVAAADVFERMIELDPDEPSTHFRYGRLLMEMTDYTGAAAAFETTLDLEPDHPMAARQLAFAYLLDDEFAKCEPYMRQLAQDSEENPMAVRLLAAVVARQGRQAEALTILAEKLSRESGTGEDRVALIYLAFLGGHNEAALGVVPPEGSPLFATVMRMLLRKAKGESVDALLETFDEIESDVETELDLHFSQVTLFAGPEGLRNDFVPAMAAVRGDGKSIKFDEIYAQVLATAEMQDEAEQVYLSILDRDPENHTVHSHLALLYEEKKDYESSEKHLRACLELQENDYNMMNTLGYLLAVANKKLDEAELLLQTALAAEPENPFYLDSMGWIYFRQGKADLAIDYIRRAIVLMERDDAILRDHLGDVFMLKGDMEEALEQWRRAYRLDPELDGVVEKLERHGG